MPDHAQFWNPATLQYRFLAEARRLWELELSTEPMRITTLQAAVVLSLVHDANSSDKIGLTYLKQAIQAGHKICLFSQPAPSLDVQEQHVRVVTAWCLFGLQA
jgi:hypothetical protein